MIRVKINSGKVLNNIDKRVIPKNVIPDQLYDLAEDYPNDVQADLCRYLKPTIGIDPSTIELYPVRGTFVLTCKTRNGFQYTTEELIDVVEQWIFTYYTNPKIVPSLVDCIMFTAERLFKEWQDTGDFHKFEEFLLKLSGSLNLPYNEVYAELVDELSNGTTGTRYLEQFDSIDLACTEFRLTQWEIANK